jgi:hypothetical protein
VLRLLLSLAIAAGIALSSFAPGIASAPARIVAIGDVHGGDAAFTAILQRAGLIDAERRWSGGKAVLVQTGDVTDRGAGVRAALDLLMALEPQASKAGGRVRMALGNHEVMNMLGETRDATPEIFASFGGESAYREAMGPKGRYGRWLRSHPAIIKIDDSLFMHAGINPDVTTDSIDALNSHIRQQIAGWDQGVAELERLELVRPLAPIAEVVGAATGAKLPLANIGSTHLLHPDGLLWFRGYDTWTDAEGAEKVQALLRRYRVKRLVTGHSVQRDGIRERFNGGVYLIDTGLLGGKYYPGGRASALEIVGATVTPIYVE